MILFGITFGGALLSHSFRFHIECNTYNSWFAHYFEYIEQSNGFVMALELCKIQLYMCVLSSCQDLYMNTSDSFFVRQEHAKDPQILLKEREDIAIIEEGE